MDSTGQVQNLDEAVCISLDTNATRNGTDASVLPKKPIFGYG